MAESLNISSCGNGSPIVFIHGWGLNSAVWQPITEKLSENYQVITIDLPGFGNNIDVCLEQYEFNRVVALVADVIDKPSIIVGWSLGGLIASQLAVSFPEKVNRLVTVASSPCFVEQNNWPGIDNAVLTGFYKMLTADTQKTINNFLNIQAMGSASVRQDVKKLKQLINQLPMPNHQTLTNSLALLETVDLRKNLPFISQPFLRLYGRLDSLVPKIAISQISALASNSECYIFDKASHAPFISHEAEFLSVLTKWLDD